MLEEALSSPSFPPAEAALALLSFFKYELPAGGTAAEKRFLRLFPLLCEIVFGKLSSSSSSSAMAVTEVERRLAVLLRHEVGGWLSRSTKWSSSPPSSSRPGGGGGVGAQHFP
eukprot:5751962-Ditylum_brightwellii.AAC.1